VATQEIAWPIKTRELYTQLYDSTGSNSFAFSWPNHKSHHQLFATNVSRCRPSTKIAATAMIMIGT
jgi:hypothetical protein